MNIKKIETNLKKNLFLKETNITTFSEESPEMKALYFYPELTYEQALFGFGGAFTEASGYAFSKLPLKKKENLIQDYFSEKGLNYTLCRLPIGSCDFSIDSYSYSYDNSLNDFSIQRDEKYIIPFIKEAQNASSNLYFLASPWSPPSFMKDNHQLILGGKLLPELKQTWANYLVKYVKSYQSLGIPIDFMTIQNEPNAIQFWESCNYTAQEEADFIQNYLYPTFQANGISTKLFIWDHNKEKLLERTFDTITNSYLDNAIAGIAFHWYSGDHFENVKLVRDFYPNKLLFHTEGCTGYSKFNKNEEIQNAEIYAHDILGDLNNGINGFCDWNLILDYQGGPNHNKNYCNSPVMLNVDHSDYYKNLSFYYIAHFSKYITPYSRRIAFSKYSDKIEVTAFKNLQNHVIIVVLNKEPINVEYNLAINGYSVLEQIDSHSIVTYIIQ